MRILLVDDEISILEPLKIFLEASEAHQVVTASSGAEAVVHIETAEVDFDCLMVDIQMPIMDGIKFCEHVRALPGYSYVPIVMLTAMSQRAYIDKAFSVGATDYITKPFDLLELRDSLRAAAKLGRESESSIDRADNAKHDLHSLGDAAKSDPEEPLVLDGVERVVSYAAFENFVMTLSRGKLLFATTFAVKIVDFEVLHKTLGSRHLKEALTSVAKAIADLLRLPGNLASYRGNGLFLCICQTRIVAAQGDRCAQVNHALSGVRVAGLDYGVEVIVGRDISLMSISRSGAFDALRKAVETLEAEAMPMKEVRTLSKRILGRGTRTPEQSKLDRRAYEVIFQDLVREDERARR